MSTSDLVEHLDIRIGKVITAENHPDADSMYVEKIDVGEADFRTIVSGLRNFVPLEEFIGSYVLVLCNLKPRKLRGIESNGMVLCACNEDHTIVELLKPKISDGSVNLVCGEKIRIGEFKMDSPDKQLNPKKKIWETCEPHFGSNDMGHAIYKGLEMNVNNTPFVAKTLTKYVIS